MYRTVSKLHEIKCQPFSPFFSKYINIENVLGKVVYPRINEI